MRHLLLSTGNALENMYNYHAPVALRHCTFEPLLWDSHSSTASEKVLYRSCQASLDLLLECSNWKSFHNCLCWLCLHLGLLTEIILVHAFVAGLVLVLMRQIPGMVNTPVFLTSFAATVTRLFSTLEQALVFMSCSVAIAFNKAPFVMAFAAPAFMDFMGGNMVKMIGNGSQIEASKRKS